jgi:hypothetical protein
MKSTLVALLFTDYCVRMLKNPLGLFFFPLGSREMPMFIISEHPVWRLITPFLKFKMQRLPKR